MAVDAMRDEGYGVRHPSSVIRQRRAAGTASYVICHCVRERSGSGCREYDRAPRPGRERGRLARMRRRSQPLNSEANLLAPGKLRIQEADGEIGLAVRLRP